MDRIKVGIVGAGGMGQLRAKWVSQHHLAQLVAVCDSSEAADAVAGKYGAAAFRRYETFLRQAGVEAVILSVPNSLHFEFAMKALAAGKHVLVEYPLATSSEEVREMVALAEKSGLILHPGHTMRFEPWVKPCLENLSRIGRLLFTTPFLWYGRKVIKWYGQESLRGNTFIFLNYHHIDQFRYLFGEVEWVEAVLDDRKEGKDLVVSSGLVMLKFCKGGCGFSMQGHGIMAPNEMGWAIVGETGYLEYKKTPGLTRENGLFLVTDEGRQNLVLPVRDPYQVDTDHFVKEVSGKEQMVVPPAEAIKTIEVCQAALRSAKEGRRIYLL